MRVNSIHGVRTINPPNNNLPGLREEDMKILWPEKNNTRKWKQNPIPFMDVDTKILDKNN